ncbi:MAG: division/cell wall cluster transcriptional repressor MraZ [Armatimonadetes bacterium]|nr:division/cell wall cluster transcriptional repressor MraZ [Armatimonadota bacterium]
MFSGAYAHSVDSKGRTVIPARFRTKLGQCFVITRGLNGCLWVFPERTWPQIQQKLTPKSLLDARGLKLERYFLGAASECVPDKQGRVAIPQMLLDHAQIKPGDETWIIGLTDKVEIWNKSAWDAFNATLTEDVLAELGAEPEND